jgi:16S rRNA (guanine966-N2)-methyltransferase
MKDRVRQAVFNILGDAVAGKHAVDLFAGTGALGLEAISRGASVATFFESHPPTADVLRRNAAALGVQDRCRIVQGDSFASWRRWLDPAGGGGTAWLAFCSPPFSFYVDRSAQMLALLSEMLHCAPAGAIFVVEADRRFDFGLLEGRAWDIREYPPSVVGFRFL